MKEQYIEYEDCIIVIRYKIGAPDWYNINDKIVRHLYNGDVNVFEDYNKFLKKI